MLTTLQYAFILDAMEANLPTTHYSGATSDPAIVSIGGGPVLAAVGEGVGTATIAVTRLADGATATLDVEVIAGDTFTVHLGPPIAQ